jgi:hypothetical protein
MAPEHDDRLYQQMDRIESKLDGCVQRLTTVEAQNPTPKLEKHDDRLGSLERWRERAAVYMTIAGFTGSALVAIGLHLLGLK